MNDRHEVVLAVLEGTSDAERTLLVHRQLDGCSLIELRQQSWGEGVGWFTQSSVQLEPQQVSQLRLALGVPQARIPVAVAGRTSFRESGFVPRLVHADSA